MSQFNIDELTSFGKQESQTQEKHKGSDRNAKKLPVDTIVTHHGEVIGEFSTISEGIRCDCPEGHLHSDGLGEDYAHTVRLAGGDIGISCSGDSCSGLFIPNLPSSEAFSASNLPTEKLYIGQLDAVPLLHFTEDMIPKPIRRWTLDNCMQAEGSLNYGAVAGIVVCSNLIGYRCQVKPKQHPIWKVTPNLWGMVIGNPSERKSPVVEQFMKPLKRLELDAAIEHKKKMVEYEGKKIEHDIAEKAKKKALQKAYESGNEKAIADANGIYLPQLEEPKPERLIMNDATTEKLGEIMSCNTRTILGYRDEYAGFFESLHKQGREGDRSFYLESFNGDSSYTYDRIGRGTVHIERLSIGLFGTIQPSVLPKYLLPKNGSGDGLIQRMQLSVFSDGKDYPYYDEPYDGDAKSSAYEIMEKLAYESYEQMPGAYNDPESSIPYFRFNDEAQLIFVAWYDNLKGRVRNEPNENIEAHLGKYYSLLPSLALTFFLIDKVAGATDATAIGVSHLELAIRWCKVLESHARKMYALTEESSEKSLQQKIVDYVKTHQDKLPGTFGEISGNIRGANAENVEQALVGIAEIDGKKVIRLKSV